MPYVNHFHPSLPVYTFGNVPKGLHTRSQWKRRCRKVRKHAQPSGVLEWDETKAVRDEGGKKIGAIKRKRYCGLYAKDQTLPYKPRDRTVAIFELEHIFIRGSSRDWHIWHLDDWINVRGPLRGNHLHAHLNGKDIQG